MARIRSIKPEFWTDGKVLRLPDSTALFFISLWNFCDDHGYFTWDSLDLSKKTGRWRSQAVQSMVSALAHAGLIRVSRGAGVGLVMGWEHQYIPKKRPSKWTDREIDWDDDAPESQKKSVGKDRIGKEGIGKVTREVSAIAAPVASAQLSIVENSPKPKRAKVTPEEQEKRRQVREAYMASYQLRWGIPPTFSVAEHTNVGRLITRIGFEEALYLAGAYPGYRGDFHVRKKHPFGLLVKDLDQIRVELKDPRNMLDHIRIQKQLREGVDHVDIEYEKRQNQLELERERNAKQLPEGAA